VPSECEAVGAGAGDVAARRMGTATVTCSRPDSPRTRRRAWRCVDFCGYFRKKNYRGRPDRMPYRHLAQKQWKHTRFSIFLPATVRISCVTRVTGPLPMGATISLTRPVLLRLAGALRAGISAIWP